MALAWVAWAVADLPSHLTPKIRDYTPSTGPYCMQENLYGNRCTRRPDHTRRHASGNGQYIVAVWP